MTEPTYRFIKGQGWVPSTDSVLATVTMQGGVKVNLIERVPNPGEKYYYCSKDRSAYYHDGKGDVQSWSTYVSSQRLDFVGAADEATVAVGEYSYGPGRVYWLTVEVV